MFFKSVVNRKCFEGHKILRFFLIGLVVFVIHVPAIEAQSETPWTPDQKVPGYSDNTHITPFLVADQNGVVHIFAVQTVGNEDRILALVCRQWNQERGWTIPIDILLPLGDARIIGVFLDSKEIMHLVFCGAANIYYSNAQVSRANNVSAWSLPEVVGLGAIDPCYGAIVGDNKGNLAILYNGRVDGNGVYSITSNDAGGNWSKPTPVFLTYDDKLIPFTINGFMGKSGKLHIVWNILNSANEFVALYYDRLDVGSNQWDKPVLLEKKPEDKDFFGLAMPYIVDNGKYVVIMYNGGNPYTGQPVPFGRPTLLIQISIDNGESWGGVTNPFPFLTGSSGEHSLVVDSSQNVHALALMRIDKQINGEYRAIGGMWHSELRNNIWGDPERLVTSVKPLMLRAVISQGNILLATWVEESVTGNGVWYSYTVLDSPKLPIVALPTALEQSSVASISSISSPIATSTQEDISLLIDQGASTYTPAQPLVFGIILVVLLILAIFIMVQLGDRRKN